MDRHKICKSGVESGLKTYFLKNFSPLKIWQKKTLNFVYHLQSEVCILLLYGLAARVK